MIDKLVLIPKKKKPTGMGDLRPIALCNVLYKIIGKVLANRLKVLLPMVISENQSAFMKGRLISDNVMISFEVLHYLKRKQQGKTGYMALKLDLSKTYDRIEWAYLEAVMKRMGFCSGWVKLVMECVTTVTYSLSHGGKVFGSITPTRGIRQGDPLSPYLFILCAEGLSSLIRKYERKKWIHGCKIAQRAPVISHMLFADDSYIYCRATEEEAIHVIQMLKTFELAVGQKVNLDKSSVFFSKNTSADTQNKVLDALDMRLADDRSLYLGLPSTVGRNKSAIFGFLKDKVRARIQKWDGKWFSNAGKEVLIKSILQAIPTYTMSVFLLPNTLCHDIESLISNFWWKSSTTRGIHWRSWDVLSTHKARGGLGFRSIKDFNLAMLGRQGWRLLTSEHSLVGRVFKAKYYPETNFLSAKLGRNPSYVWRSILESQMLLKRGARWRIGDGRNIEVLEQPWLANEHDPYITTQHVALRGVWVYNLFKPNEKEWDEDIIDDLFEERDRREILSLLLSKKQCEDTRYWLFEQNGHYTVKSAYKALQSLNGRWNNDDLNGTWTALWKQNIPGKVKIFFWKALSNCLPTKCNLQTRKVQIDDVCPLCGAEKETISHCLIHCNFAKQCWQLVCPYITFDSLSDVYAWFVYVLEVLRTKAALFIMVCWSIWRARNDRVWNDRSPRTGTVVHVANAYLTQWRSVQSLGCFNPARPVCHAGNHERWTKPRENCVKVNCDAAILKSSGKFGVGWLARDDRGELIRAVSMQFVGVPASHLAEAVSVREALSWIKSVDASHRTNGDHIGCCKYIVETDCKGVVDSILSKEMIFSPYGGIIDDCRGIIDMSNNIEIVFVKRSGNKAADWLASSNPGCILRGEPVPHVLQCILDADLN